MTNLPTGELGNVGTANHDPKVSEPVTGQSMLTRGASSPSYMRGDWQVDVELAGYQITRLVKLGDNLWPVSNGNKGSGIIWPTWPTSVAEENATAGSPLNELQQHWGAAVDRLRDSAKWMSTVLGAALASIIPAAPLAHLSQRHITVWHAWAGIAGLLCLAITMVLVLWTLRPKSVSYDEVAMASKRWNMDFISSPLYRWKKAVEDRPDLYLPCSIDNLAELRQEILVEEMTLVALSDAREKTENGVAQRKLSNGQDARAARLRQLRSCAAGVAAIGTFYAIRLRSTVATTLGVGLGFLGIVGVIFAVAQ